jgi:enoyl-CoA hydratase/carnithine racemase
MDLTSTTRRGPICTITMNRGDKRNALSSALMEQLNRAVDAAGADPTVRVVILTGAGPAFCSGLDLEEFAEPQSGSLDQLLIEQVLEPLEACPKPTIAMVHGDAIAGGCELALHCDLRVAGGDARFGMPVARIGLAAPYPLTLKLIDTIGAAATKELLFTGEMISGERALSLGMVNRLVSQAELATTTGQLADTIAANAPIAVHAMKQYAQRARQALTAIPSDDLVPLAERVRTSADVQEGLLARRERRKAVFRGE